ncbi:PLDc N-terminal domain-containing protein [Rhodococcus ruber]|uniref:PLDc N-terminal domain-containing protein n=1 Tax=Rhodococcus ruber TaxID=1830 RepID=A0ABT4M849_9NOCA|nr:PLDc N-terminal domain-containing protein [Rhodococcus ruber]MCZ4517104.1 PLDc N-terminal domain-containing protein [Rhodococcus ruber]
MNGSNPTVPLGFDLAWMAAIVVWLLLVGVAWVSILRTSHRRRGAAFWWCLLVVLMPFTGALIWFLARPKTSGSDQRTSS